MKLLSSLLSLCSIHSTNRERSSFRRMSEQLPFDVVERILVRLDVNDLIRCKGVCKTWQSFISSSYFVDAHLKHACMKDRNNRELGHRRICVSRIKDPLEDNCFTNNEYHVVGSCNGLLCVSPSGAKFVVSNPSTREHKELPTPPYQRPHITTNIRTVVCCGFGYDSSTDDYKVIVGFTNERTKMTLFHVLTLKSNTWKVIGQVKYHSYDGGSGIFCGGALHWFMADKKKVIVSLDLSTEEFKEIPLPDTRVLYDRNLYEHKLGVIEECLCIYSIWTPLSSKKWLMRNNNWELYTDDHCRSKYDIAHYLPLKRRKTRSERVVDDGTCVPVNGDYIGARIFVKSLVSPHPFV